MKHMVETLARALDEDDYDTARTVLAPGVTYEVKGQVLEGPDDVLDSYRDASSMAHRIFDGVGYDHVISQGSDSGFVVDYRDVLTIGDETLVHHARQEYTVDPERGVVHIVNVELPGEAKRVDDFLARHGRSR